jgi:hypothetical protein
MRRKCSWSDQGYKNYDIQEGAKEKTILTRDEGMTREKFEEEKRTLEEKGNHKIEHH